MRYWIIAVLMWLMVSSTTPAWAQIAYRAEIRGLKSVLHPEPVALKGDGSPADQVLHYLKQHARELFGTDQWQSGSLALLQEQSVFKGRIFRFQQMWDDTPVEHAQVVAYVDDQNHVGLIESSWISGLPDAPLHRPFKRNAASSLSVARAARGLNPTLPAQEERISTVIRVDGNRIYRAYRVALHDGKTPWLVYVDADSGAMLHETPNILQCHEHLNPMPDYGLIGQRTSPEKPEQTTSISVSGQGYVFDPDPISTAKATYGSTGFTDNNDADSPQLSAQRQLVTLPELRFDGTQYALEGPYAQILDFELPNKGVFLQSSTSFLFNRSDDAFEAVNTYYHVDKIFRYVIETLGLPLKNYHLNSYVQPFDPSAMYGADNSQYYPDTGRLVFGEGGVDDAEDAMVIWHESGHALHDRATLGSISNTVDGLSEGFSDYWAQSYVWSRQLTSNSDAVHNWVFHWDGHNVFWDGRTTQYAALYPTGLVSGTGNDAAINGQIFSTALLKLWTIIGREALDRLVITALGLMTAHSSQNDAIQAIYQLARLQGFSSEILAQMYTVFTQTGYTLPAQELITSILPDQSEAEENENVTFTVSLNNNTSQIKSIQSFHVQIPSGFALVPGAETCPVTQNSDVLSFSVHEIPAYGFKTCTFQAKSGSTHGIRYLTDWVDADSGFWTKSHDAANWDWQLVATQAHTGAKSWYAKDISTNAEMILMLKDPIRLQTGVPKLSFWHQYNTDAESDGGVVEYSTNQVDWVDMGTLFEQNGYNQTITSAWGTNLKGRKAFAGSANGQYLQSIANLSSLVGQSVWLRFRFVTDVSVGGDGWYVDDLVVSEMPSFTFQACVMEQGASTENCGSTSVLVLSSTPVEVENPDVPDQLTLSAPYPNPFSDETHLDLRITQTQSVTLEVFDLMGRKVMRVFDGVLAGQTPYQWKIPAGSLPNGVYIYQVRGEHFMRSGKIVLRR